MSKKRCQAKTEVYSRVVGYFRPVQQWNIGKKMEFKDRITYSHSSGKEKTGSSSSKAKVW